MSVTIRAARPEDIDVALAVYAACISADATYLPFLSSQDPDAIRRWFLLKPLDQCLVAVVAGRIVGVAGLRAYDPNGVHSLTWMESCRLAVHPDHRGRVTKSLTAQRLELARDLGVTQLWLRCVAGSSAHRRYLELGWQFLAPAAFAGAAAVQDAVLLSKRF